MDPYRAAIHVDAQIAALAERQGGVASRSQLLEARVSAEQIKRRLRDGRLRAVHRGVYALGQRKLERLGLQHAALRACPGALSHREGGSFWDLRVSVAGPIHVTVSSPNGRRRRAGIVIHRAPLPAGEWVRRNGLVVTSPARTLFDLASVLDPRSLQRAADEAHLRGLVNGRSLAEVIERNRGRDGAVALREFLRDHELGTTATETDLEERFVEAYTRWGRRSFTCQKPLKPYRADLFFAAEQALVEVDGPAHRLRSRQRSDAVRDARLAERGLHTIRVTDLEMDRDIRAAVGRVDRELDRRSLRVEGLGDPHRA